MLQTDNPWDGAMPAWVALAELLPTIERELGIPPDKAAQSLRPALEAGEIDTAVIDWPVSRCPPASEDGRCVTWIEVDRPSRNAVRAKGWVRMDWQNGTIFGCEVKVRWEQVVRALAPVSAEEERRTGAMTETVRSIGGKPPRRDWDAFWIEVALYVSANDLFQTERTEVQRHMAEWSAEHMEDPAPDLATVRAKIRKLYDAVERARK